MSFTLLIKLIQLSELRPTLQPTLALHFPRPTLLMTDRPTIRVGDLIPESTWLLRFQLRARQFGVYRAVTLEVGWQTPFRDWCERGPGFLASGGLSHDPPVPTRTTSGPPSAPWKSCSAILVVARSRIAATRAKSWSVALLLWAGRRRLVLWGR